ncbi:MAG: Uma2 family endonuclease [Gemmatimonadota bacterium]
MTERLLTVEEYEQLDSGDGYKDELVRGKLVREPGPGARHGEIVGTVVALLKTHARAHRLGKVFVESGFVLEEKPATVRGPDISFVGAERASGETPLSYYRFAPDLAIEVLSPSNRASAMNDKVQQYLAAGTRQVWVLDPRNRMVVVYRADGSALILNQTDELRGADVMPGFQVMVTQLFEES